jgi:hypothetical protein
MNTNIIKFIKICFIMTAAGVFLYACEEEPVGQQPVDSVAPGAVTNVQVHNIAGGAKLSYTLPGDEDLLYVKAVYERNGEICESRTSLYRDTLTVEGYGDMQTHEVKVIAVDRSMNESEPVTTTVQPLKAEVTAIGESIYLEADFGGVTVHWKNETRANISVVVLYESDSLMEYIPLETFYSSAVDGRGDIREMDTIPEKFGVYVRDHWGNTSEPKHYELTPIFETKFDPSKFRDACTPDDGPHDPGTWLIHKIWDGIWGEDQGYSSVGGTGKWPHSITIDLGVTGKISRIRIHQRMGRYTWAEGNLRNFEIYGATTLDPTGNWDSWTLLMECESIKPSGLPGLGEFTNEDEAVARDGEDFYNSPQNPAIRYIRIRVTRTWAGGDNFQITEMEVFGDNRNN